MGFSNINLLKIGRKYVYIKIFDVIYNPYKINLYP
jgi:hypothetical protein